MHGWLTSRAGARRAGLSAADATGRVELVNVSISGEPKIHVGQVAEVTGLVGFVWEQTRNGEARWGIAYRADTITAASPAKAA